MSEKNFKERLTKKAEDFDGIVAEMLSHIDLFGRQLFIMAGIKLIISSYETNKQFFFLKFCEVLPRKKGYEVFFVNSRFDEALKVLDDACNPWSFFINTEP